MKTTVGVVLLSLLSLLAATSYLQTPPTERAQRKAIPPAGTTLHRDLAYVPMGHPRQKLDLYLPAGKASFHAGWPLIIYIHGGAFMVGDKSTELLPVRLLTKGYALASLNYRLSGDALFPAQIEDCKTAVRWLRAHAREYGLDPTRFVSWGESAGATLAALLGTTGQTTRYDVGENLQHSSAVQAVVDYYGPTDFLQMDAHRLPGGPSHDVPNSPEAKLIGGPIQENREKAQAANPITYLSKQTPPFFIAHGMKDHVVPYNQSKLLVAALQKAGVKATFYPVPNADHVFKGATAEQRQQLRAATEAFLKSILQ